MVLENAFTQPELIIHITHILSVFVRTCACEISQDLGSTRYAQLAQCSGLCHFFRLIF